MKNRKVRITKVFTFDSAHRLIDYKGKCSNIHGHTYKLEVTVIGINDKNGMVVDFHHLDDIVSSEVLLIVDHKYLNDVFDFNPTSENIVLWMWDVLESRMSGESCSLKRIVLWETPTSFASLDREDMI